MSQAAVAWIAAHVALAAALVLLEAPASLTDEDEYMPHALADVLAGRNPYATRHSGIETTPGPWGGSTFEWETHFPYFPALAVLQIPGIDYRWTALLAYAALLLALRDRPLALVAFANPIVARLAASGFNDFVPLALLAWSLRGRSASRGASAPRPSKAFAWLAGLAAAAKQFALPIVLLDCAIRREWRRAALATLAAAAVVLPFVLWDPAAFWRAVWAQNAERAGRAWTHPNYWLWPLFALALVVPLAVSSRARPRARARSLAAPRVAVVLPALDEEGAVAEVVRGFRAAGARVVVVDNGSADATAARAREAGAEVVREPRRGYGSAVLAGIARLRADPPDVVAFADCDGTIDPADLAALVAPVAAGDADLALGRRAAIEPGAMPLHQRAGNAVAAALLNEVHGLAVRDIPPLRAARWELVAELDLAHPTYGLPVETLARAAQAGARVVEVDVAHRRRAAGESKVAGTWTGAIRAGFVMLALTVTLAFRRSRA